MNLDLHKKIINDFFNGNVTYFVSAQDHKTQSVTVPNGPFFRNHEVTVLAKNILRHKRMMIAIDRRIAARNAANA